MLKHLGRKIFITAAARLQMELLSYNPLKLNICNQQTNKFSLARAIFHSPIISRRIH